MLFSHNLNILNLALSKATNLLNFLSRIFTANASLTTSTNINALKKSKHSGQMYETCTNRTKQAHAKSHSWQK